MRVYAENINGRGSYCITTDFGDQLSMYKDSTVLIFTLILGTLHSHFTAPSRNVLNGFSSSRDSTDSSAILLTWTVLPLDQAKGFITLSITFGPLAFTNELETRQKRQTANECSRSPCQILYEEGRASVTGLDSQEDYFIIVVPQNEEGEIGTPTALGIPAMVSERLASKHSH